MRKKILLMLSAFCFMGATVFGQAIEGGAGIIHVDGNPNENEDLNAVSVNEGNVAYDKDNQIVYYFNPIGTDAVDATPGPAVLGTHWIAVDIANLVDPITNILTPEDELSVSITNGVATITFESDATIEYFPATNTLTFTDVDGHDTDVDLSSLNTPVSAADLSVTVTNVGTAVNPDYEVGLTGATTGGNAGMVPVTNGTTGALTWTDVVENVTITNDGQIQLTMTSGGDPINLDLDSAPKVANKTDLDAEIATLTAAAVISGNVETGIVVAAENNTFGMPADSDFGVIFFIKSN